MSLEVIIHKEMPKIPINLEKIVFFLLENEKGDKYVNYTTDFTRRKYRLKCKVQSNDIKLVFCKIRESPNGFDDWKMTRIENFPSAKSVDELQKRKQELIKEYDANLNADETRFNASKYKREWYLKRKLDKAVKQEVIDYFCEDKTDSECSDDEFIPNEDGTYTEFVGVEDLSFSAY